MSTRVMFAIAVLQTLAMIGILTWHAVIAPATVSEWMVLHMFNIGLGVFNMWSMIDAGLRFGWKS